MHKSSEKLESDQSIVIWDMPDIPNEFSHVTALWNSYSKDEDSNAVSILKEVEERASYYRGVYLGWVYELGELEFRGKKIVQHLELQTGLSYWWLTRICEKCSFSKSPQIENAIKLIAFDELFRNKQVNNVDLISPNKALAACVEQWCESLGITFTWSKQKESDRQNPLKNITSKSNLGIYLVGSTRAFTILFAKSWRQRVETNSKYADFYFIFCEHGFKTCERGVI